MTKSTLTNVDHDNLMIAAEWGVLNSLEDKIICVTGALSVSRGDMERFIHALGGVMTGTVNTTTDYLVCSDPNKLTAKLKEATVRGVPILSEEEFCGMIVPTVEELLGGSNAKSGTA